MKRCPKCGYVDPAAVAADRRHEAKRGDRSAYMREYRARKAAEAKAAKKTTRAKKGGSK